jgi:hypothetical protein
LHSDCSRSNPSPSKAAVVAPEATVTDAGKVSEALPLASVTLDPPAGAVWVSVTVHVLTALWPILVGLQTTPEIWSPVNRLMVAVWELALRVAVTVALRLLAVEAAAVAVNVAVVAPEATVTDAGTESEALLLASVTIEPPAAAAVLRVTVQVAAAPGFRFSELHVTDEMAGTVTTAVAEEIVSAVPVASTPTGLVKVIAVVPVLDASVSWTLAITPAAIVLVFDPISRHLSDPDVEAQ